MAREWKCSVVRQHIRLFDGYTLIICLNSYVKTVPGVNRIHLVRSATFRTGICCQILLKLSGAAKGLEYLHSCNVIHGNGMYLCYYCDVTTQLMNLH